MQASWRKRAMRRRPVSFRCSRCRHSASTRRPARSSGVISFSLGCSIQRRMASAIPLSFIATSFSIVCSTSMRFSLASMMSAVGHGPGAEGAARPRRRGLGWSVVVAAAADVLVERQRLLRLLLAGQRELVEVVLEHRGDAPGVERPEVQRPRGGPLDSLGRVLLREPQHAEARLEALLRVRLRGHDRLEQRGGLRPRLPCPVRQPLGGPLDLVEMGARHVLLARGVPPLRVAARVALDPRAPSEDLNGGLGRAQVELLPGERVVDAVEVVVVLDVVAEIDPRPGPLGVLVAPHRQRLQGGALDLLEELAPRLGAASAGGSASPAAPRPRPASPPSSRRCGSAAPPGSSGRRSAPPPRLWPCRAACTDAPGSPPPRSAPTGPRTSG